MTHAIVIPWRPAPSRLDAFQRVVAWYSRTLPAFRVVTLDTGDDLFSLSRIRNLAVAQACHADDVIVIGDADTLPERGPLMAAIAAAPRSGRVQLPYTTYRWLGPTGTAQHAAGRAVEDCDYELVHDACSGVYVTTRNTWESHGGQDERFQGWGFEDSAWYLAHQTLLGAPPQRHEGAVYALHHSVELRDGPQFERNVTLMARYRRAAGDQVAMRHLVDEGRQMRASGPPGMVRSIGPLG
ncbi:hypothetical protein [Agromyces sp. NPDC057865]|uniref:hypothetical protein n=1 Tax=Agromyces sp. NPDC057865 TaxID=3346267 RepID=UPI00366D7FBD